MDAVTGLLVVGQAPGRGLPPGAPAFWNSRSLRRLAELAGVEDPEQMYDLADFVNVWPEYPGREAEGRAFWRELVA